MLFYHVSHFFSEVFKELVPGGEGMLIMKTSDDTTNSGVDQADDEDGEVEGEPTG